MNTEYEIFKQLEPDAVLIAGHTKVRKPTDPIQEFIDKFGIDEYNRQMEWERSHYGEGKI